MREGTVMSRSAVEPDTVDRLEPWERRLLNRLQDGIPLVERPFAAVAAELGLEEAQILAAIERFLSAGLLTRFGPLFDATTLGGSVLLAAMAVPPEEVANVAQLLDHLPEVAHNYERDHELNLWFVVIAPTPEGAEAACRRIEAATGLEVLRLPKEREYVVDARFYV